MRKTSKRLLLLVFIVLSLLVIVPTECYAQSSTVLGSTHDPNDEMHDLEVQAMAQITQYIFDCSVASGYTAYNWFGSETTEDHIYDAAYGLGHTYAISFFIGHGEAGLAWNGIVPEWQYWIYDNDGNRAYDREIYPNSECQNLRFVFLWSCKQGNTIGGKHWSQTHYGMPYAWLHTTDLSTDGYASPDNNGYCFIGIDGGVPYITDTINATYAAGYYFIGHFYRAALCEDKTINEALDYASKKTWNVKFGESILYNGFEGETDEGETFSCRMVVYGDGNLKIGTSATAPTLQPAPPIPPNWALTISVESPVGTGTTIPSPRTWVYTAGSSVEVTAYPAWGCTFDYWLLDGAIKDYDNPIIVTMDSDHTLEAYFTGGSSGGGGGGGGGYVYGEGEGYRVYPMRWAIEHIPSWAIVHIPCIKDEP